MVLQTVMVLSKCSTAQCKLTCIYVFFFLFRIFQDFVRLPEKSLLQEYYKRTCFFSTETKLHIIKKYIYNAFFALCCKEI